MGINLFIFIADSWGTKEGGINSFNFDLSLACARIAKTREDCRICCVVPGLSDKTCNEIKCDNVLPITLQDLEFGSTNASGIIIEHLKANLELRRLFPERSNTFFIGHDVYTGELAEQCAIACNGWSIVFHHMDYASYYLYKNSNVQEYNKKIDKQKDILCAADFVCAVGPKLKDSAQDIVRRKKNLEVLEVFPGIANFIPIEKVSKRFSPIVFGRVEEDNQRVKQISLAIYAYAKAIANDKDYDIIGPDSRLSVIGYKDDDIKYIEQEVQRLNENALKIAHKLCNIVPLPYISNRKQLEEKIAEASVAMMLSFHEGFGLVGYEAIAAGVPVIISKNTGLYQFLNQQGMAHYVYGVDIEGSFTTDGYSENDLDVVSTALMTIRKNESYYKKQAIELRKILITQSEKYSWNAVAQHFINKVFYVFNKELKSIKKNFYQPQELKQLVVSECDKGIVASYLKFNDSQHVFKVEGNNALSILIEDLKELYSNGKYKVLIYNILSTPENKSDAYEYFIADCQDYFDSGNQENSIIWFAENELVNKLHNTILILNHFSKNSSIYFDTLFSILEDSKDDFLVFTVLDTNSYLTIQSATKAKTHPSLCETQQLLIKILSFFKRAYTKKIIKYICNAINLYLEKIHKKPIFIDILEDECALYEAGLIEEFSEYSCQNTKLLYEIAKGLEIDNTVYSLGVFELGRYYARCYCFNRKQDPQLNWGVFSCQCFRTAIEINSGMKQEIKKEYEAILFEMRFKFMRTAQYERYIRLLQEFIDIFKEPDNLWIWYNLLHCKSIFQPKQETLKIAEEILYTKIRKLDLDESKNAQLYIQFIRLCAELENDLGCNRVTGKLLERVKLVSTQKIGNVILSQYITTLITVAIDQDEFELATNNIKRLKKLKKKDNPYPWINACALEITIEIIKFKEKRTKTLGGNLSDLEKAYKMACNLINDIRSQSWINGIWGEYLMLKGEQEGEKKIKYSLMNRRRSGEKSKSYRNWLTRICSMELSLEMQELVRKEIVRTETAGVENIEKL